MSNLNSEQRRSYIRQLGDSRKPADAVFRKQLVREETREILARRTAAMNGKPVSSAPAAPATKPSMLVEADTEAEKLRKVRRELIRKCGEEYSYNSEAKALRASLIKKDVRAWLKGE